MIPILALLSISSKRRGRGDITQSWGFFMFFFYTTLTIDLEQPFSVITETIYILNLIQQVKVVWNNEIWMTNKDPSPPKKKQKPKNNKN